MCLHLFTSNLLDYSVLSYVVNLVLYCFVRILITWSSEFIPIYCGRCACVVSVGLKMFENLLLNFKSKLNLSSNNNLYHDYEPDYSSYDTEHSRWSSVALNFFQRFSTRSEDSKRYASIAQHHANDEHGDAYFGRNSNRSAMMMFPRVSNGCGGVMEPIDLAPSQKNMADMDNVVDKFIRVIHPRPADNDYVHSIETERLQKVIKIF